MANTSQRPPSDLGAYTHSVGDFAPGFADAQDNPFVRATVVPVPELLLVPRKESL